MPKVLGGLTAAEVIDAGLGFRHGSSAAPSWTKGTGTPEGAVTAPVGSIFSRTDGSTNTAVYRKETGVGNTGWVATTSGGAVESVDGRTGDVTLDDLYVDVSGDLMTGPLVIRAVDDDPDAVALRIRPVNTSAAPSFVAGIEVLVQSDNAVGVVSGLRVEQPFGPAGITQAIALELLPQKSEQTDSGYGVFQKGPDDFNSFAGPVMALKGITLGNDQYSPSWTAGWDSPEGVVTAAAGSLYSNAGGGAGTTLYVKEAGYGDAAGWSPLGAGGVTSVDGQTGDVVLSGDYVNISGDQMTGALQVGTVTNGIVLDPTGLAAVASSGTSAARLLKVGQGAAGVANFDIASAVYGADIRPGNAGLGNIIGLDVCPRTSGVGGTVGLLVGARSAVQLGDSTRVLTNGSAFRASSPGVTAGGVITTAIGVDIFPQKVTGVTTGYGVYQQSASDINHFAGIIQSPLGFRHGDATAPAWSAGAGTPEGSVAAPVGSMFSRTDGGTNTAVYRKETGVGNTGWVAVAAAPADAVTSVDGRTGVVTLADKYVDVSGDNMTGHLGVPSIGVGATPSPAGDVRLTSGSLFNVAAGGNYSFGIGGSALVNLNPTAGLQLSTAITMAVPGANIELNKNELRNPVSHKLSAAPASPAEGQWYYDTTLKAERYWNGTAWVTPISSVPADLVTSVDGRTGAVTLADKYVDITGDTMTGSLVVEPYVAIGTTVDSNVRLQSRYVTAHTTSLTGLGGRIWTDWSGTTNVTDVYLQGLDVAAKATLAAGMTFTNGFDGAVAALIAQSQIGGDGTYSAWANGVYGRVVKSGAGNLTNAVAFNAPGPAVSGAGVVTNAYGVSIGTQKLTGVTNAYGLYQWGANDLNYFAGKVGAGGPAANAPLTVGTNTTASTGGIYFGTDTNLYRSTATVLKTDGSILATSFGNSGSTSTLIMGNDMNLQNAGGQNLLRLVGATAWADSQVSTYVQAGQSAANAIVTSVGGAMLGRLGIVSTGTVISNLGSGSIPAPVGVLDVVSGAVGKIGLIVKGVASQAADLQQWQSSTAGVLASVKPDGALALGTNTATTGLLRLPSQQSIMFRNAANTADAGFIHSDAGNHLQYNAPAATWHRLLIGGVEVVTLKDNAAYVNTPLVVSGTINTGSTLNFTSGDAVKVNWWGSTLRTGMSPNVLWQDIPTSDAHEWRNGAVTKLRLTNTLATFSVPVGFTGSVGIGGATLPPLINLTGAMQWGLDADDQVLSISGGTTGAAINIESTLPIDIAHLGKRIGSLVFSSTTGQSDAHRQLTGIVSRITGVGGAYTFTADLGFFAKGGPNSTESLTITHDKVTSLVNLQVGTVAAPYGLNATTGGRVGISALADPSIMLTVGNTGLPNAFSSAGAVFGIYARPTNALAGDMYGIWAQPVSSTTGGTIAQLFGANFGYRLANATGTLTAGRGINVESPVITAGGVVGSSFGIDIWPQKVTGVTTGYGIYQRSGTDFNHLQGRTAVGYNAPTSSARLRVDQVTAPADGYQVGLYSVHSISNTVTAALSGEVVASDSWMQVSAASGTTLSGSMAAAVSGLTYVWGAGAITTPVNSVVARAWKYDAGSITTMRMFWAAGAAVVTGAGNIGTVIGLDIEPLKATGITNAYGIYQRGTTDTNSFAGPITSTNTVTALTLSPTGMTGAVQFSRYAGATAGGAPTSGTFAQGDWVIDRVNGRIYICTVAGTPGTWVNAATGTAPNTGWSVTAGYTADKSFNPATMTIGELANVVGTLVDALKMAGILSS